MHHMSEVPLDAQFREVGDGTEAAKALADDAPSALILREIFGQTLPNSFTITDDIVCTEVLQVLGLLYRIPLASKGACSNGRAQASTSLIEKEDLLSGQHTQAQRAPRGTRIGRTATRGHILGTPW